MSPIRAIVGRFSMDLSHQVMEEVLKKHPFEFCGIISAGKKPRYYSNLSEDAQEWFVSNEVRSCLYEGADWNAMLPIDEELIESMRECEAVFMEMVSRLEWKKVVPYQTRKRWYLRHLRFWNDYIERNNINLYLSAWIPHEIPDIVIYFLCKLKNIPVHYFHMSTERDSQFAETDINESAIQIQKRYEELLKEYEEETDPNNIPVSDTIRERFTALTEPAGQKPALQSVKLPTYLGDVKNLLITKPLSFLRCALLFLTPSGMKRAADALRRSQSIKERNAYFDAHAIEPDMNQPYVYMALHFQPEASTTPMGGAYTDQVLMAQLLNAYLPDDVLIYVKEHYRESSAQRTADYYKEFTELKKVRLIARHIDSFALREHCKAVATATGTVGMEGIFRGKPVFMFGHRFYQYTRGVYRIHSKEDLQNAVQEVFVDKKKPSLVESLLYLKAMEDTRVHGTLNPWDHKASHLSDEEHVKANAKAVLEILEKL